MQSISQKKWTHPSVINFALGQDPVSKMEEFARNVVFDAFDKGWPGPPFDPIKLADILRIPIKGNADVTDARTIPIGKKQFCIEFNPNRPRARIRFTIAHEIAHTFFPDCADNIQHRNHEKPERDDHWQLELLCNIAAAEIVMPVGTFQKKLSGSLNVEELMKLRPQYDVSAEAILHRAVKLTDEPVAMFCASRVEEGSNIGKYRIDYLIPSKNWNLGFPKSKLLPTDTLLAECTAIGYTNKGKETWAIWHNPLDIGCVGLYPYPGKNYPRVAGILKPANTQKISTPNITELHGNVFSPPKKGEKKIIAHIVNDKTPRWGGGGFAQSLNKYYPEVGSDFKFWASYKGNLWLGNSQVKELDEDLSVYSMIAQHGYGDSNIPRIRYSALSKCLERLRVLAQEKEADVHMPRIGTGHAGGKWDIIKEMIDNSLCAYGVQVYVYELPPKVSRKDQMDFLSDFQ